MRHGTIEKLIAGAFAETIEQDAIMEIVSAFHYRDLYSYEDGSIGRIEISSQQLRDLLAYCFEKGCEYELDPNRGLLPREPHG